MHNVHRYHSLAVAEIGYNWTISMPPTAESTVPDNCKLQSCMVGFRMVSTFFIDFFSDFSRKGFVEN